jgi:hypothetical protein
MSDELEKPARPEPKLQPMRIVQVPDTPVIPTAPGREVTPNNPTGKKLVMSKKEIEAAKRAKAKPSGNIPFIHTDAVPTRDQILMGDAERNSRLARNIEQAPEIDTEWLKEIGGEPTELAWLQTAISVSGFISSDTTLSSQKIRGLSMSWMGDGLRCQIKNHKGCKQFFIPAANVKIFEVS